MQLRENCFSFCLFYEIRVYLQPISFSYNTIVTHHVYDMRVQNFISSNIAEKINISVKNNMQNQHTEPTVVKQYNTNIN